MRSLHYLAGLQRTGVSSDVPVTLSPPRRMLVHRTTMALFQNLIVEPKDSLHTLHVLHTASYFIYSLCILGKSTGQACLIHLRVNYPKYLQEFHLVGLENPPENRLERGLRFAR